MLTLLTVVFDSVASSGIFCQLNEVLNLTVIVRQCGCGPVVAGGRSEGCSPCTGVEYSHYYYIHLC